MINNTQELERKTINILQKGYMPTSNKNLLTFVTISALIFAVGMPSYSFGYQQAQDDCAHNLQMYGSHIDHTLSQS